VLFVGVHCPVEVVMARRDAAPDGYETSSPDRAVPPAVARWQHAVHRGRTYDLEVDTSTTSPDECAELITSRLTTGPPGTAFARLRDEPQKR
jgi:chloramphenicol 3-O phosphotransferase